MKVNRKFVNEGKAVSAVIGIILMVAITVAIAATVYVYVSGMLPGTSATTPTISWTVNTANNEITITKGAIGYNYALANDTDSANLVFKNSTGITYYILDDMSIVSSQGTNTLNTDEISAGDVITGFMDGTWTVIWKPTNTVIGTIEI